MEDIFFDKLNLLKNYEDWDEVLYKLFEFTEGTTLLEDNILKVLEIFDETLESYYHDWFTDNSKYIPEDVSYDEVKPSLDIEIRNLFIHFFTGLFSKISPDSSLNVHFPKILKWFDELVEYWDLGLQPYLFTSFIESLKGTDILKKNFLLILKWFDGQDFENIYEPFKKLIEIITGTPIIDDYFQEILEAVTKIPQYHTSNYREQAAFELSGSYDTEELEKMFDEDPEGFKNSVDNFPAFELGWLICDFIRAIKGTNVLETHFTDIVRFFENHILKSTSISKVAFFLELFEAIKDTELLKHHYSAVHKLFKEIKIPSKGYAPHEDYLEAKKYFENGFS